MTRLFFHQLTVGLAFTGQFSAASQDQALREINYTLWKLENPAAHEQNR